MRLRELREARNENQQKLAILLNVSQTMISRYELGQATPDVPMLITLSKHYNVSIDYLLENTDVKSPFISSDLSEAETEMLSMYRRLTTVQQEKVTAYIQGLLLRELLSYLMLYPLAFLGLFCIVETVKRSNQITGYPSDPFKRDGIIVILYINEFSVYCKRQVLYYAIRMLFS